MDKARANDFIAKAEKLMRWGDISLEEMREHGRHANLDDVERIFVSLLWIFDSTHQALTDASKKLAQNQWREQLILLRERDLLLRYIWKARNSETHDSLIKWKPSIKLTEFQIVDPIKAHKIADPKIVGDLEAILRLFCYVFDTPTAPELFELFKNAWPIPSLQRQAEAGVELLQSLDTLSLNSFSLGRGNKVEIIEVPSSHLGKEGISQSADTTISCALTFYRNKLNELKALSDAFP